MEEEPQSRLSQNDRTLLAAPTVHGAGEVDEEDEFGRVKARVVVIIHTHIEFLRLYWQLFDDPGLHAIIDLLL